MTSMYSLSERLNAFGGWLFAHLGPMSLELAVLALVVYAVIHIFRINSPTVRHLFWALVLLKPLASLLMVSPISLYVLLPERPAPVAIHAERAPMPAPVAIAPPTQTVPFMLNQPAEFEALPIADAPIAPSAWRTINRYGLLALGWLMIAALLLLRLLLGLGYVVRLRRAARDQVAGKLMDAVAAMAPALRVRQRVRVGLSDRVYSPVLAGIAKPVILFPAALATSMPPEQLRLLLAHELAHARRCDNAWLLLQRLAESLLFFHPAVWICGRMMRREAEFACDAAVLATFGESAQYADSLIRIAELRLGPSNRLLANTVAAAESNLATRIRRILDGRCGRTTIGISLLSSVALLFVGALSLPAGWREREAEAEINPAAWTTILDVDFNHRPPPYQIKRSDPGLTWALARGEGRFAGTTTDTSEDEDWAEFSATRDGQTRIEISCGFRVAASEGYYRVGLSAITPNGCMRMFFEGDRDGGHYGINPSWMSVGNQLVEGDFTAPGFGDETNVFHSMRIVLDRTDMTVDYFVDNRHLCTRQLDRLLLPVKDIRLEFVSPNSGEPVDVRFDNLWVGVSGPVRDGRVAYDPAANRALSDEKAADTFADDGTRLYSVMTTQGASEVEIYLDAATLRPFTGVSTKRYVNGVIERRCPFVNGLADGIREEWYPTGVKTAETSFQQGLRHGPEKRWHENGQMSLLGSHWHGHRDGEFTQWFENGQLRFHAVYRGELQDLLREDWQQKPAWKDYAWWFRNGIPEGVMTYWDDVGQVRFECELDSEHRMLRPWNEVEADGE